MSFHFWSYHQTRLNDKNHAEEDDDDDEEEGDEMEDDEQLQQEEEPHLNEEIMKRKKTTRRLRCSGNNITEILDVASQHIATGTGLVDFSGQVAIAAT